jgi:hypothetical protein
MPATGKTYSTGLSIINRFNLVDYAEILVCRRRIYISEIHRRQFTENLFTVQLSLRKIFLDFGPENNRGAGIIPRLWCVYAYPACWSFRYGNEHVDVTVMAWVMPLLWRMSRHGNNGGHVIVITQSRHSNNARGAEKRKPDH